MDDSTTRIKSNNARGSATWPLALLFIAAIAVIVVMQMRRPGAGGHALTGQPLPPLADVGGWLNTDAPLTADNLRGQVVLVDYWASWCGPCRANMPHLVELHKSYRDSGLVMLGVTPESAEERENFEPYIKSVEGMDWPIAYGAQMTLEAMGITGLPTLVLYDRTGTSVWAGHSHRGLEDAVVAALARK